MFKVRWVGAKGSHFWFVNCKELIVFWSSSYVSYSGCCEFVLGMELVVSGVVWAEVLIIYTFFMSLHILVVRVFVWSIWLVTKWW